MQERRLWVAVLRAQAQLGVEVPDGVVAAYEAVVGEVDLASIARREAVTRHDVKARIEEFCALAGHEHIHRGMTSRDLTENVEQLQVREALELVRDRVIAVLARVGGLAATHADRVMVARTHNVSAQATTLGKRFADVAEELMIGLERPPVDYRDALLHRTDLMLAFIRHAFDAGVYFHDYGGGACHHGFSLAHTADDIDRVLEVMDESLQAMG